MWEYILQINTAEHWQESKYGNLIIMGKSRMDANAFRNGDRWRFVSRPSQYAITMARGRTVRNKVCLSSE